MCDVEKTGFQFLCNLFSVIYTEKSRRQNFAEHSGMNAPFSGGEVQRICGELMSFACSIREQKAEEVSYLFEIVKGVYKPYISNSSTWIDSDEISYFQWAGEYQAGDTKSIQTKFQNVFRNQKGPMPEFLLGIAISLTAGRDVYDSAISISGRETREILSQALRVLNLPIVELMPESCFENTDEGRVKAMQVLEVLGIFSALRVVFPHKKGQAENNRESGREIMANLLRSGVSIPLIADFDRAQELSEALESMRKSGKEDAEALENILNDLLELGKSNSLPAFVQLREKQRIFSPLVRAGTVTRPVFRTFLEDIQQAAGQLLRLKVKAFLPAFNQAFFEIADLGRAARIHTALCRAMYEDAETISFPNGAVGKLSSFYRIPNFEPMNPIATPLILGCDCRSKIRAMVFGNRGSGKTLLVKAVLEACLAPKNAEDIRRTYAEQLGLNSTRYFPLLLKIRPDAFAGERDFIADALDCVYAIANDSPYRSELEGWENFRGTLLEYCRRKAEKGELLLILEDISALDADSYRGFMRELTEYTARYPMLHILGTSEKLLQSQMRDYKGWNCVEIAPIFDEIENIIDHLAENAVICEPEAYKNCIRGSRYIAEYLNSSENLIRFLCRENVGEFSAEELIQETVNQDIIRHLNFSTISEPCCRGFLTALAVYAAEGRDRRPGQEAGTIPMNITTRRAFQTIYAQVSGLEGLDDPGNIREIWEFVRRNMILLRSGDGINGFRFSSRLFYCSLTADYYQKLLTKKNGTEPTVLLNNFNRMNARDFSMTAAMLFRRMAVREEMYGETMSAVPEYQILPLIQSISAYMITRPDISEVRQCLYALDEILSDSKIREVFANGSAARLYYWNVLKRVYADSWRRYENESDDPQLLSELHPPESV